ncbi:hypothetical protein TWF281_008394 [Arthrobotrys megalospora]
MGSVVVGESLNKSGIEFRGGVHKGRALNQRVGRSGDESAVGGQRSSVTEIEDGVVDGGYLRDRTRSRGVVFGPPGSGVCRPEEFEVGVEGLGSCSRVEELEVFVGVLDIWGMPDRRIGN